jgi:hypothetical protein
MKRGVTLAEVLLTSSLTLLVLALVVPLYKTMRQILTTTQLTQLLQTESLTVSQRLRSDYLTARPGSLVVGPGLISFLSYREGLSSWDERGQIVWRKWIQYRYQSPRLERREILLRPPSTTPVGDPPPWPSRERGATLARYLSRFEARVIGSTLEVTFTSSSQGQISASQISLLPQLYGSDSL